MYLLFEGTLHLSKRHLQKVTICAKLNCQNYSIDFFFTEGYKQYTSVQHTSWKTP